MTGRTAKIDYPLEDTNTLVVKTWGDSKVKVCKFIYVWTIHNFMLWYGGTSEMLLSPTFPEGTDHGLKWNLRFQSKGDIKETTLHFPIHITLAPTSTKNRAHAKFIFSILSKDHKKFQPIEGHRRIIKGGYAGLDCFISQATLFDKKNGLLPDDKLSIHCEITTLTEHLSDYVTMPECNLSVDLGLALANQELSDVTLSVNGICFKAHKVILSARSPVFRARFNHETSKKKNNEVVITDMVSEVLEEMLHFIYTGEVAEVETSLTIGLLAAADKYQLKRLKMICEKQLINNLSTERVTEMYIIADRHDAKHLKARAKDYIVTHSKDVIKTNEWQVMTLHHPNLYKEVFCGLVDQQVPSLSAI